MPNEESQDSRCSIEPLVISGSLSRPHLPLLKWINNPLILVEPQEEQIYKAEHPELQYKVLPESGRGFSYMMNQMVNAATELGQRYFIFTDDDVFGLKARASLEEKFQRVSGDEARNLLREAVSFAQEHDLAQLAISFSGQSWSAKKAFVGPTGSWGVYICDAWAIRSVGGFDEDLWIFSDWEMSARLIRAGYKCWRTNLLTFEHKMRGMDGGAAWLYEHKEKVSQACSQISTRYGEAVKIKWVEAHGQHEIRFNWKKLVQF